MTRCIPKYPAGGVVGEIAGLKTVCGGLNTREKSVLCQVICCIHPPDARGRHFGSDDGCRDSYITHKVRDVARFCDAGQASEGVSANLGVMRYVALTAGSFVALIENHSLMIRKYREFNCSSFIKLADTFDNNVCVAVVISAIK